MCMHIKKCQTKTKKPPPKNPEEIKSSAGTESLLHNWAEMTLKKTLSCKKKSW